MSSPFVIRRLASRRALSAKWSPALLAVTPPPAAQPVSAWLAAPTLRRRETRRALVRAQVPPVFPATPAAPAPGLYLEPPKSFVIEFRRKLKRTPPHDVFPPATGPPAQPISAVFAQRTKRRKHRQGLFLSGGETIEARVQPQYPSYEPASGFIRRRETKRKLREVEWSPSYPATPGAAAQPVTAWTASESLERRNTRRTLREVADLDSFPAFAPVSAWTAPKAFRSEFDRTLQDAGPQLTYPQTPAVGAQPEDGFRAPKQHRIERARRLIPAAPQITYPATPAVQEQPLPAWREPQANHVTHERTLRTVPLHDVYPATPVHAAHTPAKSLKRRETKRKHRLATSNAAYPATPAPPQAPTAFKLAEAFRRHGWRKARFVLELDEHPESPERSKPTLKKTLRLDRSNRTHVAKRSNRTLVTERSDRKRDE